MDTINERNVKLHARYAATQLFCSAGEINLECVVFERFPFSVYGFKKEEKKLSPVDFTVPPGRSFG